MNLSTKQKVFALNVSKLIQYIMMQGYSCTFGEAYRTPEQAEIYAKNGKGIQDSLHCKRLAIDLNLFSPTGDYLTQSDDYELFGKFWESMSSDNVWGGRWKKKDGNHFQMSE